MEWAALIVWVITALGGLGLLTIWIQNGGFRQAGEPGRRIRPPLILAHPLLAATGLVLWIIYVASDDEGWAWAAFILVLIAALLGFAMLALWLQGRQAGGAAAAPPAAGSAGATAGGPAGGGSMAGASPAEQHFPVGIVGLHGVLAAATLVLVLLAALEVG